jgi:hypothetical protein
MNNSMWKQLITSFGVALFQIIFGFETWAQEFSIVSGQNVTNLVVSSEEEKVVHIASELFSEDVFNISGQKPKIHPTIPSNQNQVIIAGTIGRNKVIDELIRNKQIDVSAIKGKWETWSIELINNPFDGIKKALVIVGSDRRATAYGILELSRKIGVSPWVWWADVIPERKETINVTIENKVYGSPSVKYRGIFLNDEDWGLQRWAALTYEPETNDIGPKTYAKVFELLLRLRANTIWPAMHSCTKPFYSYEKNKQVADDYAIVIGTSHCEPMLCNINAEWNSETMGEWRYDNNAETIKDLFYSRANETSGFESIYTMGMRGEHDSPMIVGEDNTDSQKELLEKVIADQRSILEKQSGKKTSELPQVFIPYKEVLKYYQAGMDLPEDITLVWTDDNYGYIRQLSTPEEQKRLGGAGIYYHTSYWGRPHDYLWLNSTNPVLMWEEMSKAYEFQARNVWVLNCGDIKPHEYNIELFLDMGWNMNDFENSQSVRTHMQKWAAREFGKQYSKDICDLLYENYRLAFQRRPEFMAWSQVEPVTKAGETELTQIHYGDEVTQRIEAYQQLIDKSEKLKTKVPSNRIDAYYQLVHYPIVGTSSLNQKWLYSYKNKTAAQQERSSTEYYGKKSLEAYERIKKETYYYNEQLQNGKWNHIMSMSPRHLPVFSKTISNTFWGQEEPEMGLALEGYEMELNYKVINSFADVLPVFNYYTDSKYFIDVFLKGNGKVNWQAQPKEKWIKISQENGVLDNDRPEQRIWISIDWENVPQGENKKEAPLGHDYQLIPPSYKINSAIDFVYADTTITVGVSVFNPKFETLKEYKGFVEDKGFISIHAENYTSKTDGKQAGWEVFEGLGYTGNVASALPRTVESQVDINKILENSPVLEYDFYSFNFGEADVFVQVVPTHAFHENSGVRCAVAIDDAKPEIIDFKTIGRSDEWKQNVLRNAAIKSAKQIVNKAGKHKLKVWMVDPGVMIDQILIDLGGWKKSYSFPPESINTQTTHKGS